ncbi:MAG: hypothetical protein Q9227_008849 [Pyrenula ochraceoflavens]
MLLSLAPFAPEFLGKYISYCIRIGVGLPIIKASQWEEKNKIYNDINMMGDAPDIALFGREGARVGVYNNKDAGNDLRQDDEPIIQVPSWDDTNGEDPEYITVSAGGPDAICISDISVTSANTGDVLALLPGEIAAVCNGVNPDYKYPWMYSAHLITFKNNAGDDEKHAPKCLFIDGDGNTPYQGFTAHLTDFKIDNSTWKSWQNDPHQMCDSLARFGMRRKINNMQCPQIFIPPPLPGARLPMKEVSACIPDLWHPDPAHPGPGKHLSTDQLEDLYTKTGHDAEHDELWHSENDAYITNIPRRLWRLFARKDGDSTDRKSYRGEYNSSRRDSKGYFHQHLVRSDNPRQSAVDLCSDSATRGPHFYSEEEGMLCETDTHILYPRCVGPDDGTDCFDSDSNRIVEKVGPKLARRERGDAYKRVDVVRHKEFLV